MVEDVVATCSSPPSHCPVYTAVAPLAVDQFCAVGKKGPSNIGVVALARSKRYDKVKVKGVQRMTGLGLQRHTEAHTDRTLLRPARDEAGLMIDSRLRSC
uniref:Uncharacterized protein n=1 Tax=Peronospora matthiolae TaxID=2874970 RepID=A0AAV1TQ55_9STRA